MEDHHFGQDSHLECKEVEEQETEAIFVDNPAHSGLEVMALAEVAPDLDDHLWDLGLKMDLEATMGFR